LKNTDQIQLHAKLTCLIHNIYVTYSFILTNKVDKDIIS